MNGLQDTSTCLFCKYPSCASNQFQKVNLTSADNQKEQLKTYFILSKVLKLPQNQLHQCLDDHPAPEVWKRSLCWACDQSLICYYAALNTISKLQKKMTKIEIELKEKIRTNGKTNCDWIGSLIHEHVLISKGEQVNISKLISCLYSR